MTKTKNKYARGRSAKAPTYSLKTNGQTIVTTPDHDLAERIAETVLNDRRSVSLYDNTTRRAVARWIYGHREELTR